LFTKAAVRRERRVRRGSDRIGVLEDDGSFREGIEVRRRAPVVAVDAEGVGAQRVEAHDDDVEIRTLRQVRQGRAGAAAAEAGEREQQGQVDEESHAALLADRGAMAPGLPDASAQRAPRLEEVQSTR
jgi:hypothetical protein